MNGYLDFGLLKSEIKNITFEKVKTKGEKYLKAANDLFDKIYTLDWEDPKNYLPLEKNSWVQRILYKVPSLMKWEVKNPNPVAGCTNTI